MLFSTKRTKLAGTTVTALQVMPCKLDGVKDNVKRTLRALKLPRTELVNDFFYAWEIAFDVAEQSSARMREIAAMHASLDDGSKEWKAYVRAMNVLRVRCASLAAQTAIAERQLSSCGFTRDML